MYFCRRHKYLLEPVFIITQTKTIGTTIMLSSIEINFNYNLYRYIEKKKLEITGKHFGNMGTSIFCKLH